MVGITLIFLISVKLIQNIYDAVIIIRNEYFNLLCYNPWK
jgi:hypothetical protein